MSNSRRLGRCTKCLVRHRVEPSDNEVTRRSVGHKERQKFRKEKKRMSKARWHKYHKRETDTWCEKSE